MDRREQDALYGQAITEHGAMILRLARGYEADPERRRDLLQDIHLDLWRSLGLFDGRCALRAWVCRVAHNVAASHIVRRRRIAARLADLEALDVEPVPVDEKERAGRRHAAQRLLDLIRQLRPVSAICLFNSASTFSPSPCLFEPSGRRSMRSRFRTIYVTSVVSEAPSAHDPLFDFFRAGGAFDNAV